MPQGSLRARWMRALRGDGGRPARRRAFLGVDRLEGRALLSAAAEVMPVPALASADDSGTLGDFITNVSRPHLVGDWTPGDTVEITTVGGVTVLGQSAVSADGSYAVQFNGALADGTYPLLVRALDPSGAVDGTSPVFVLTIETTPPPTPSAPVLDPADATAGPGATTSRQPTFTGLTEPGAVVDLLDAQGDVLATTGASIQNGTFSIRPASLLPIGVDAVRFQVHDAAGNWSAPGASASITVASAPDDFAGLGRTEPAVYRPGTGQWIVQGPGGTATTTTFGAPGLANIPVPADYDGVGHAEPAVYYPATGTWAIQGPNGGETVAFGAPNTDIPVPADYDGVGHAEVAVFRPSTGQWLIDGPNGVRVINFGATGLADLPVPGDYDGVGHAEPAVFRPSTGQWLILGPNGVHTINFGATGLSEIPVPGDYDGIGRVEPAVFQPSTGQWSVLGPNGVRSFSFGAAGWQDVPMEAPIGALVQLGLIGQAAPAVASNTPLFVGSQGTTPATTTTTTAPAKVTTPTKKVVVPVKKVAVPVKKVVIRPAPAPVKKPAPKPVVRPKAVKRG